MVDLLLAVTVVLGWTLAASGVAKLRSGTFESALAEYRLLPAGLVRPVARSLPWLELMTGAMLLLGPWPGPVLMLVAAMLVGFAVAVAIPLLNGHRVPCGCRGRQTLISWHLVAGNAALATVAVIAASQTPPSLIGAIAGRSAQLGATDTLAVLIAVILAALCLRLVAVWHGVARALIGLEHSVVRGGR